MIIDCKGKKKFRTVVVLFIIVAFPAITRAQAETLLSLYKIAGIEYFSGKTEAAVPRYCRERLGQALASGQGEDVMNLIAERGFALRTEGMLALTLPGGGIYAAVPLEGAEPLRALTCADEGLREKEQYRISTFLSYKSLENREESFCFVEVFEHRGMDSKSKIRWLFPRGGGYELTVENCLPRIRPVDPEGEGAIMPAATYGICEQLYNLFVELISIGLILVELGYLGLLTVVTLPLGIFFLAAAIAFDFFGYLVLGLDIACFLIQSILQFIF